MKQAIQTRVLSLLFLALLLAASPAGAGMLASNNIPLDSPVYSWLDKLASFGLIGGDFWGIRPFSKAEAARLLAEAERNLAGGRGAPGPLVAGTVGELQRYLAREIPLHDQPENAPPFDVTPLSSARARYVFLEGAPRSYERPVHDPGGEGVFGIGSGLRPDNPYPSPAQQHGSEGTPLLENNEGVSYSRGSSVELRLSGEAFAGRYLCALLEPMFLYSEGEGLVQGRVNKGYAKLGGGGVELEVGRDANWLGLGERGNITLTNNARNFDLVKLSSPEPVESRYLWDLKYALIVARFDETVTAGQVRQPYFVAAKLSMKPTANVEFGLNVGKQVGGEGVDNSLGSVLQGVFSPDSEDNSNALAGLELRWRMPFLRNTELYGEFSGEDSATFWPIVESYVAGLFIPRLTADGRNDLRFEYFLGNRILYTNGTFPAGYNYHGMPVGHSQGGATQDFFVRYRHWFSPRHRLALEYFHTERGNLGRVPVNGAGAFDPNGVLQAVERKNAVRASWKFPLPGGLDAGVMYGWERVDNLNLVGGARRTNQLATAELSWGY